MIGGSRGRQEGGSLLLQKVEGEKHSRAIQFWASEINFPTGSGSERQRAAPWRRKSHEPAVPLVDRSVGDRAGFPPGAGDPPPPPGDPGARGSRHALWLPELRGHRRVG